MLTQICDYVHNYFERDVYSGTFEISGGTIHSPALLEGQRFKICDSALNDGIYTYHSDGIMDDDGKESSPLQTETFDGVVIAMGVPISFLKIVDEIIDWQNKYGDVAKGPYTSESFGGYSYTKATKGSSIGNSGIGLTWQDIFHNQLNAYRKIA